MAAAVAATLTTKRSRHRKRELDALQVLRIGEKDWDAIHHIEMLMLDGYDVPLLNMRNEC